LIFPLAISWTLGITQDSKGLMTGIVSHFSQPPYAGVNMISMPNVASYVPDSTKRFLVKRTYL
jgi:hypothetical protein